MSERIFRKFLIILLLSLIFVIEIGYASFSTELDYIDCLEDNFDIKFENANIVNSLGVDLDGTMVEISPGGKNLNVNVSDLQYPGAGVEFSVDVVNRGDYKSIIEAIITKGLESDDIRVNILNEEKIVGMELEPNESQKVHFTVVWDYNSTKAIKEAKSFKLIINCRQSL